MQKSLEPDQTPRSAAFDLGLCFFTIALLCDARFVYVEILRPSQPYGVMSSAVSLPNSSFTGQA